MIAPHGGKFVERILTDHEKAKVLSRAASYPTVEVDDGTAADVKNIARGVYSPLTGFMTRDDLDSVVKKMRLTNGLIWSIPIVLSVPDSAKSNIRNQEDVLLVGKNKKVIALMKVEDIYEYDKETFAEFVFSTKDKEHPGVAEIKDIGDTLIGGSISLIDESREPFEKYNLEPKETRFLFKEMGWKTIAAFQTRNAPHMAHEYLQRSALEIVDGLFINPVIGKKKKGDFKDKVILDSYKALIKNYYPKEHVFMSILQMEMRYAGPREAIHHAIIRKNFGCTHIIIGRDHAGVGDFYHPFAAHKIFNEFPHLNIKPIFFKSFFECKICGGVVNDKTCPHKGKDIINFSGTKIRDLLSKGKIPPSKLMRSEVSQEIVKHNNPFVI